MIAIETTCAPTYRAAGRPGRRSLAVAYRDAARAAWRKRYPCECERETGYDCGEHDDERDEYRRKVIGRLVRWLRWRDSVSPVVVRPLVVGDVVAFTRLRLRGRPKSGMVTEVGTVVEITQALVGRAVSVLTAWAHESGDQRLDGTMRWLVPESWCVRIEMQRPRRKK